MDTNENTKLLAKKEVFEIVGSAKIERTGQFEVLHGGNRTGNRGSERVSSGPDFIVIRLAETSTFGAILALDKDLQLY